jgi:uncharacterized RDD family membrane protein YckC
VWARSPGKALLGLTLIDTNGRPPGARQAVGRAATYVSFWSIAPLLSLLWVPADPAVRIRESSGHLSLVLSSVFPLLLPATVFCTARRRNGYAGLHDLASRTRIVEYRVHARSAGRATPPPPPTAMHVAVGKLGPFSILGQGTARMPAGWLPGFDARLRRSVWIREAPPGAPPLDSARLAVDRATRLRWLAGRRGPDAAWDVFEAVPGVPLEDACARPRTWADVRWWLLDLACECAAHSPEDAPPLRADRVWILESGGAKLLDDPAVDRTRRTDAAQEASCAALLLDVVRAARGPDAPPWPLAAQRFVHELSGDPPPDNTAIARALEPLTRRRAVLTRGWRALSIAALSALPVFVSGFATLMAGLGTSQVRQMPLDVRVTVEALGRLARADSDRSALSPQDRQAIEVALATRYRPTLTHLTQFPLEYWPWVLLPHHRQIAERLLLRHPTDPDSQQVTRHLAVQALIRDASKPPDLPPVSIIGVAMLVVSYGTAALISLVTALAFRGGITRILGLEFVTADGKPASRLRVLGRTALAWLPLLLPLGAVVVANAVRMPVSRFTMSMWASGVCVLLALAVVIVSILHPERGIQDRLAGTWIVPR